MMHVRAAEANDIPAITAVYAHHVLHGFGTFEETPPGDDEMAQRWGAVRASGLPWLVAEEERRILGYAYAGLFRTRSAYRFTVEDSVYVAPHAHRQGAGRALLERLIADCAALGMRQMLAVIGDSANAGSIALHAACGFEHTGMFREVGFKHERWVDIVFMQRGLG